jgi:NADH:quinone reductase (non-electrogenic)
MMGDGPRILIVGGGYGGLHTALRLERLLRPGEATVMVADSRSYTTYQPLLAEAAAGNLEPRHVVLPIPGLTETGIGFKTVGEAIHLRNHVLGRLDAAASATSAEVRRAALTFVFVGGGYAGVEALAELQDMAFDACARYPELRHNEMRWMLVEAADRILPEVGPAMADYTTALLRRRHIEVRNEFLAVEGTEGVWALGDCAAVPDLAAGGGAVCAPTAQHAYRQARRLAGNIVAVLRGATPRPYRHASAWSVASLGLYRGVASGLPGRTALHRHRAAPPDVIPRSGEERR